MAGNMLGLFKRTLWELSTARGEAGQASAQGQQPQLVSRSLLNALIS